MMNIHVKGKSKSNDIVYSVIVNNKIFAFKEVSKSDSTQVKKFSEVEQFFDELEQMNLSTRFLKMKAKLDEIKQEPYSNVKFNVNKKNWPQPIDENSSETMWDLQNILIICIDNIKEL
jgi:hypothetical protein